MGQPRRFLKRAGMLLLCALVMLGAMTPALAREAPTLRVAFYPLDGFFEYDAQGKETGYGVEVLRKITQYTGIRFTYVPADSWESTKAMLLNGEADIRMPGTISATPSTTLGYTQHGVIDTYYAVLTLKSRTDLIYEDFETFHTLRFGISKNLYDVTPVKDHLDDISVARENLVFYAEYNDCKAALDAGEVDAVISNIMDLDDTMKPLARFTTRSNYISMTLGNPDLDTLNDALSRIKLEEPTFLSNLYGKWFPERVSLPLTKKESAYLATMDSLCFSFQDGQGYLSHRDAQGDWVGFYPAVARVLCEKLGIAYRQIDLERETPDGIVIFPDFYYDYTWAQERDMDMTQPYRTVNYYELSRRGGKTAPEACRVAAVENFRVTQDYIADGYGAAQMVWCKNYAECIEAVYSGKADLTYVNSYAAEYYLTLYRYSGLSATLTEYSHQACFGVWNDETGLLASALGKVLSTLTGDDLEALMVETTALKPEQNLFMEWIYENPARSALAAGTVTALFVVLIALAVFVKKTRGQNLALRQATDAKQEFLSRMSHDMRTPMNAIIGFSAFGEESHTLGEATDYHRKIREAGQYLLQLINDTLDLNKMETGLFELHPEPYSSDDFIETLSNIFIPKAREKGVAFRIENELANPRVLLFDKIRLQQIFVNLINNAIKFTPPGGRVTFAIDARVEQENRATAVFTVTDDGVGMTEAFQREKLYKPFVQERRLESAESGTGLGLSIVKELVSAMGGTICCKSAPEQGTTFTVILQSEVAELDPQSNSLPRTEQIDLTGKRILLCEDHPLNREIAGKLLAKTGAVTENAEDGRQGLERFQSSPPRYFDAILMDIRMPVMDGLEASRAIRGLDRADAKSIPIIAMTANAYREDVEKSIKAGMNAHLAKPIDPHLLYRTLAEFFVN